LVKTGEDVQVVTARELSLTEEVEAIERDIELYKHIHILALRLTNEKDWIMQGPDSPYLMDRGAEKIAVAFGVDIFDMKNEMEWHEDAAGRYYQFVAKAKGYSRKLNRTIEDEGTCSQRDEFFGMVKGEFKKLENVDMTDIRKKAVTNVYGRIIKRVVGLSGITTEQLKEAGLDPAKIKGIERREGQTKADAQLSPELLTKRNEAWKLCLELGNGDEKGALENLKAVTVFKGKDRDGKEMLIWAKDIRDLKTEKWINQTLSRLKDLKAKKDSQEAGEREPGMEG